MHLFSTTQSCRLLLVFDSFTQKPTTTKPTPPSSSSEQQCTSLLAHCHFLFFLARSRALSRKWVNSISPPHTVFPFIIRTNDRLPLLNREPNNLPQLHHFLVASNDLDVGKPDENSKFNNGLKNLYQQNYHYNI